MRGPEGAGAPTIDLDRWLDAPTIRTYHETGAPVDAQRLWAAACSVRLDETHTLGRLVSWRIPGTHQDQTFREMFAGPPFLLLDEGPTHAISGLCGRIWTFRRDYPQLRDGDEFRAFREGGAVRVLFAHWAQPAPGGGATLHSEARVEPVDRKARFALGVLWRTIGMFERRIGSEAMTLAVERAVRPAGEADGAAPS